MNKIELRKRTPEERAAYAEGFAAGYQKGLEPQTVILKTNLILERSDYDKLLERLDIQMNNGVMLLGPGLEFCSMMPRDAELERLDIQKNSGVILLDPELEFCGVAPRDAEIEVVRKASEDDA